MISLAIGTDMAVAQRTLVPAQNSAPVILTIQMSSTTPRVGETISCQVNWEGFPRTGLTYQWRLDGTAISGATTADFTPLTGMQGKQLSCAITIANGVGTVPGVSTSYTVLAASLSAVLVIVAGQSNAQAADTSAANAPAAYATLADAWMWVTGSGFARYAVGVNSDATGPNWGSEAEFIRQMNTRYPGRAVYVVKEAANGTSMSTAAGGASWHPTVGSGHFKLLETQVNAARTALSGAGVTFEEVSLFNQGEADTVVPSDNGNGTGTYAENYQTNFRAFLTAYRARISTAKFVVERIRPYFYNLVERPYGQTYKVRRAQEDAATELANVKIISLDFDPTNFGALHPGAVWAQEKGLRCFSMWNGDYDRDYGPVADTVPSPFVFDALLGAEANKPTTSSTVAIQGIGQNTPISVTGGEYRVRNPDDTDWLGWTIAAGIIHPFQKAQLRVTSPAPGGSVSATLTIGGVSAVWNVSSATLVVQREPETLKFAAKIAASNGDPMSTAQTLALDAFFAAAKASTWWAKVKRLYVGGLRDSVAASIDLKDQNTLATQVSAVSGNQVKWLSKAGWYTEGEQGRGLNMQFNPSTGLPQPLTSVALFLWCPDFSPAGTSSSSFDIQGSDLSLRLRQNELQNLQCRLNSSANQTKTGVSQTPGFRCASRTASNVTNFYGTDGGRIGTTPDTTASAAPTATSLYMFAPGTGSTSARKLLVAGVSEGLEATEVLALRNALAALGAGFWLA